MQPKPEEPWPLIDNNKNLQAGLISNFIGRASDNLRALARR